MHRNRHSAEAFEIWIFPKCSMERPMRKCNHFSFWTERRFSGGSLSENKKMLSNLSVIYMEENENNNL